MELWGQNKAAFDSFCYEASVILDVTARIKNEVNSLDTESAVGGRTRARSDGDWLLLFLLQAEDKGRGGWLNPGPTLGCFWATFSKSEGLGAGDPVYFPPWSLLDTALNNRADWGSLCTNTVPAPTFPTPALLSLSGWPKNTTDHPADVQMSTPN